MRCEVDSIYVYGLYPLLRSCISFPGGASCWDIYACLICIFSLSIGSNHYIYYISILYCCFMYCTFVGDALIDRMPCRHFGRSHQSVRTRAAYIEHYNIYREHSNKVCLFPYRINMLIIVHIRVLVMCALAIAPFVQAAPQFDFELPMIPLGFEQVSPEEDSVTTLASTNALKCTQCK